ncbi:Predicted phosphoesterase [Bosea sp. 62]|jgi:3',5'-cyclic AMP phosphodiesterase CpdA|uniref:metallophosphoesterase n=1 Tax=unclassified Bosea (in: a-proteobacteria) TaxID=2653178 RepID=UPI0012547097|nr:MULTISPECIES: metallophosphoesterase [unclassified Bosea (in: a-proteobacteria)]CAD5295083.1 Predicted phosphoesterase [Bosea sp. 21B]CAD5295497.1 Predicted phosphoesterase [Bosea sp. 46]CAD5298345.1 Predicted phosphoesterase [Bosea sp. 7B]VVT60952.1 Predicted phosphoesterase [Bosea sp. EC-HK365B]VXB34966.1 Predicted phosphoesterase [Bosea sp. 127]
MRLLVLSDLHLEFENFGFPGNLPFDVAIFAGDTWQPVSNTVAWLAEQRNGPLQGKPVVVVPGNHEYYGCRDMMASRQEGRVLADQLGIHLLDPGSVVIAGVRFIGATLWTNFGLLGNPIVAKRAAEHGMNDYRRIGIVVDGKRRRLRPSDTQALHRQDVAFIEATLAQDFANATVIVTHHAPHPNSVDTLYGSDPLSAAYASDLTELLMKYQPNLWIHGHDHRHHNYWVGGTQVIANPAGYHTVGGYENRLFDPCFIVDV